MRRRREQGYSLVELVAALTIFSLGVVSALNLFTTCLRSTSASKGYTHAVLLAQGKMEETLADGTQYAGTDSGDFGDDHSAHSWEMEILDTEQMGLMEVRLVVTWMERGREKEYALTTLAADRGYE